tara:strand:- start:2262 stop:2957 length:696 start_codon:yes stop_codon:yes gene_type:complete
MTKTAFTNLTLVVFVAASLTTGCRTKRPDKNITPIPGMTPDGPGNPDGGGGILDTAGMGTNIGSGGAEGMNIAGIPGAGLGTGDLSGVQDLPIPTDSTGTIPMDAELIDGMYHDRSSFSANTVYFGYDSSVVRAEEIVKLDEIVQVLQAQPGFKLLVEGHCDERGTEEYNRALGERRANAVREQLIGAGLASDRIRTLTYGEDKPAEFGHDEGSWARNRRSEFILLRPPSN